MGHWKYSFTSKDSDCHPFLLGPGIQLLHHHNIGGVWVWNSLHQICQVIDFLRDRPSTSSLETVTGKTRNKTNNLEETWTISYHTELSMEWPQITVCNPFFFNPKRFPSDLLKFNFTSFGNVSPYLPDQLLNVLFSVHPITSNFWPNKVHIVFFRLQELGLYDSTSSDATTNHKMVNYMILSLQESIHCNICLAFFRWRLLGPWLSTRKLKTK